MFGPSASVAKCFSSYRVPGHFAENQGEHYVSLEQVTDHNKVVIRNTKQMTQEKEKFPRIMQIKCI